MRERQTDRQIYRDRQNQISTETDRQTKTTDRYRETDIQKDRQNQRQTDTETDRQTGRQRERRRKSYSLHKEPIGCISPSWKNCRG